MALDIFKTENECIKFFMKVSNIVYSIHSIPQDKFQIQQNN